MRRGLGKIAFGGIIAFIGLYFVTALAWTWISRDTLAGEGKPGQLTAERPTGSRHPVVIRQPDGKVMVDSGRRDARGEPVMVACATCHDTREPVAGVTSASDLDEFHQGLTYAHGNLSCLSCHNAEDYDALKLADGRAVSFAASMTLCAQCHGPQFRDYQNGSHGGMSGHWDLTQGGRTRNSCIDCHDPHHPAYPQVMPVFPPKPERGETLPHAHHE